MKKQPWEKKYEKYKQIYDENKENAEIKIDRIINGKIGNAENNRLKATTPKQYRQAKTEADKLRANKSKTKQIVKNLPKIAQIKENRDTRVKLLEELLATKQENESIINKRKELGEKSEKLELELKGLEETREYCYNALSNPNASVENKSKATETLKDVQDKIGKNNAEFSNVQLALQEESKREVKPVPENDIKELKVDIEKDNKICELLLQGYVMKDVIEKVNKEKEKTENVEKVSGEKATTENAEKVSGEKATTENAEKASGEKEKTENVEKASGEKEKTENVEKASGEKEKIESAGKVFEEKTENAERKNVYYQNLEDYNIEEEEEELEESTNKKLPVKISIWQKIFNKLKEFYSKIKDFGKNLKNNIVNKVKGKDKESFKNKYAETKEDIKNHMKLFAKHPIRVMKEAKRGLDIDKELENENKESVIDETNKFMEGLRVNPSKENSPVNNKEDSKVNEKENEEER